MYNLGFIHMLEDIVMHTIVAIIISGVTLLFGLAMFKNDQKNKNEAIDTRFKNVDKDISKNDERIHREIKDLEIRNQKEHDNFERELHSFRNGLTKTVNDVVEMKTMMVHLDKSVGEVNKNVGTILNHMISNPTSSGNNNEPKS